MKDVAFLSYALLLLFVLAEAKPPGSRGVDGLYSTKDKLQLLNVTTFDKYLLFSKTAWIVEFYSSWCGHCRNYAPTWKELANELYGWRNVARMGAIDCADEDNTPVCRSYQVMQYPTVRFFPPGMTSDKFIGVDIPSPSSLKNDQMRKKIADYVEEVRVKYSATHFPHLGYLDNSAEDLPESSGDPPKVRVLVFEWDGSADDDDVGRSVILDASLFDSVSAHRAKATHPLYLKYDVKKTPAILFIDPDGKVAKELSGDMVSSGAFVRALKTLVPDLKELAPGYNTAEEAERISRVKVKGPVTLAAASEEKSPTYFKTIFSDDMLTAIRYSLLHEVALHPSLKGDDLANLGKFLVVLADFFPGSPRLVSELRHLSEVASTQTSITADAWLHLASPAFSGFTASFVGCQGSESKYRGYPCGLWTLFHALTVEAAIKGDESRHRDVVEAIHGFVKSFFSCGYCSKHFDEMYTQTNGEVTNLRSAVMWLWSSHNKVNRRLAGDISEDPKFPKIQFPPEELCSDCMNQATGRWNEDRVYAFLLSHYGRKNVASSGSAGSGSSSFAGVQSSKDSKGSIVLEPVAVGGGGPVAVPRLMFTLMDLTLCSAMYVLSIAVLVFVYFYFVASKRIRRRSMGEPLLPKWAVKSDA